MYIYIYIHISLSLYVYIYIYIYIYTYISGQKGLLEALRRLAPGPGSKAPLYYLWGGEPQIVD